MCSSEALSTGRPLWCRLHWRCALLPLPPPARQRRERRHPRAHLVAHFNSSQMMRFSSLASSPSSRNAPPLPAACFSRPAADRSLFKPICMHAGARRRREWRRGATMRAQQASRLCHNGSQPRDRPSSCRQGLSGDQRNAAAHNPCSRQPGLRPARPRLQRRCRASSGRGQWCWSGCGGAEAAAVHR